MAPPNIKMNPDGVRQAAAQLRADAEKAKGNIGSLFHSGNEASAAHAGWNSGAALRECGHAWWKELTTLVEQTAWTAWKLDQSANNVTAKDRKRGTGWTTFSVGWSRADPGRQKSVGLGTASAMEVLARLPWMCHDERSAVPAWITSARKTAHPTLPPFRESRCGSSFTQ